MSIAANLTVTAGANFNKYVSVNVDSLTVTAENFYNNSSIDVVIDATALLFSDTFFNELVQRLMQIALLLQ